MSDWTCRSCNWVNRYHADRCLSCGDPRSEGSVGRPAGPASGGGGLSGRAGTVGVPSGGAFAMPGAPTVAAAPPLVLRGGFAGGLAAGVVAAIVATAVWYAVVAFTDYQVGFVAVLVGWLIGTAVVLGSRRRLGLPLIAASGALTLLSLVVSEYLIVYHMLTSELGVELELLMPPDVIAEIVFESISFDPATLVFWAFAVGAAVWIPFKAMTAKPPAEDVPQSA